MTGDMLTGPELYKRRLVLRAGGHQGQRRRKRQPLGSASGRGGSPCSKVPSQAPTSGRGHRRKQSLGVGVRWGVKDGLCRASLDDGTEIHRTAANWATPSCNSQGHVLLAFSITHRLVYPITMCYHSALQEQRE